MKTVKNLVERLCSRTPVSLRRKSGFSLVEVNMAIMVIGLGMLVLFGLFPTGLREGENALINTHCALFADAVFNGLRAEATQKTWTQWQNWVGGPAFRTQIPGDGGLAWIVGQSIGAIGAGSIRSVKFPASGEMIHYIMEVGGGATDVRRSVWLWVQSTKHATSDAQEFKDGSMRLLCGYFYSSGENE